MRVFLRHIGLLLFATLFTTQLVPMAYAREKPGPAPIGYGGPHLRLSPIMVPYRTSGGVQYQPLVIEVELATGGGAAGGSLSEQGDAREKQACWALPIVHEKLLMYLFNAHLVSDDFAGERRDVLTKNLFDVLINTVGRGYYAGLTLVPDDAPALDSKSMELSKQCR